MRDQDKHRHARLPVAVHIFLLRENHVLLLRRVNTGYEDGNYSVVAGHLDGGESVTQAAIREAYEEVGVLLRPEHLTVASVMHRVSNDERIDFFLVATTWSGTITNREPDKCTELRWCALDTLPANTIPYVRAALENCRRGVWFAEFGWHETRS
jgi:8-oxo-dGTP pyrophosphatase MutT (NUDIX family)